MRHRLTLVQPVTGFHVELVHSIAELSLMAFVARGNRCPVGWQSHLPHCPILEPPHDVLDRPAIVLVVVQDALEQPGRSWLPAFTSSLWDGPTPDVMALRAASHFQVDRYPESSMDRATGRQSCGFHTNGR